MRRTPAVLLCVLVVPTLALGCQATPPPIYNIDGGKLSDGPYPAVGACTLASAGACNDPGCDAKRATGKPDGKSITLRLCGTLDLVFTSGTATATIGSPDLKVFLGGPVPPGASIRVEGSPDGNNYTIIGFIGDEYPGVLANCEATLTSDSPPAALIDASNCNPVPNVNFVRFSEARPGTTDVMIDAVEALSFSSRNQ